MTQLLRFFAAILALALAACGEDKLPVPAPTPVHTPAETPAILAAYDEARAHLDYFRQHLATPEAGESSFSVRVRAVVTSGAVDHEMIWISDVAAQPDGGFSGRIDARPHFAALKPGQTITASEAGIVDWGFLRNGAMIGFYSTRAALDQLDPETANNLRARLGENPQ